MFPEIFIPNPRRVIGFPMGRGSQKPTLKKGLNQKGEKGGKPLKNYFGGVCEKACV